MLVSCKEYGVAVKQGGTADNVIYSSLIDLMIYQGLFYCQKEGEHDKAKLRGSQKSGCNRKV